MSFFGKIFCKPQNQDSYKFKLERAKELHGQPVKYVTEHKSKSGTPTMGGVFFIISACVAFLIFTSGKNRL